MTKSSQNSMPVMFMYAYYRNMQASQFQFVVDLSVSACTVTIDTNADTCIRRF